MRKKSYFKEADRGVEKKIWSAEFQQFHTRIIREGIRVQYDRMTQVVDALASQIKNGDNKETTKAELESKMKDYVADVENLKKQMDSLDEELKQVEGQIESLYELKKMIREYLKTL